MRDAKRNTKQRFLDETTRSATEGEETATSAEPEDTMRTPVPRLDIGDGDGDEEEAPSTGTGARVRMAIDESPPTTSRAADKTPRSASMLQKEFSI
jgi:hypothetical protein